MKTSTVTNMQQQAPFSVIGDSPWSSLRISPSLAAEYNILPARFSAQAVLIELFNVFERKLNHICSDEAQVKLYTTCNLHNSSIQDKVFSKPLRRGEDPYFDNLLRTLSGLCEICLPPVLVALTKWHEAQQKVPINESGYETHSLLLHMPSCFDCLEIPNTRR